MPLPLTSALLDQILFAMEDQDNFSVLNLDTLQVETCADENTCGDGRVLPLPSWSSSDGFRMMREFSEGLSNPAVQAELRALLDSGHGVFRRFKQVLKPRDLLYRQWLRFKRRFMEDKVREWIEQYPEVVMEDPSAPALGIDRTPLLADFSFREGRADEADRLADWDLEACLDLAVQEFGDESGTSLAEFFRRGRRLQAGDRFWVAENPQAEWAGVVWARPWSPPSGPSLMEVLLWFVDPSYRQLGLGAALMETLRLESGSTQVLLWTPPQVLWSGYRGGTWHPSARLAPG